MRELLFRGFHPCDGPDAIVVDGEKVKGEWIYGSHILIDGAHYIMPSRGHLHDITGVIPSTVGQYTGLQDKNGKRVFELDKVKGENDLHQREEVYDVMWECNNGSYFVDDCGTEWHPEHVIPCKVIGTVFDEEALCSAIHRPK